MNGREWIKNYKAKAIVQDDLRKELRRITRELKDMKDDLINGKIIESITVKK